MFVRKEVYTVHLPVCPLAFDTLVPHDFSADIIHGSNNLALVILDIFRGQIVDEVFK